MYYALNMRAFLLEKQIVDNYKKLVDSICRARKAMTPQQRSREFKRQAYIAKRVSDSSLLVSIYGLSEKIFPFTLTGKRKVVTGYDAYALESTPLMWNIHCYALCIDSLQQTYLRGFVVPLPEPIKQSAIQNSLATLHYEWMNENINKAHLLTLGWVATTAKDPDTKLVHKIFDGLGAFTAFDICVPTEDGNFKLNPKELT